MGIWITLQDRYVFIAVFTFLILANIVLLYAAWKSRANIPKGLAILIYIFCLFIIVISLAMFIFTLSFGYNS